MKKARFILVTLLLISMLVASVGYAENEAPKVMDSAKTYLLLPEMNLRLNPETPGKIDSITAGTEVHILYTSGIWAVFTYEKDGEERTGCTWSGAVGPAVRIHLLESEFIFHQMIYDREMLGNISAWREPDDPDLLILREETAEDGSKWFFIRSLDGRSGYMRQEATYEIVE